MSKQKRPPKRSPADKARVPATGKEATVTEQSSLGNQAMQSKIGSVEVQVPISDWAAVRDEALPVVERAMIALYTEPRAPDRVAKFISVLESSRLPDARKATLIERLVSDQEAAVAVASAAERWFGEAGLEARTGALAAMDGLWAALEQGASEAQHPLTESTGSLGERADQLLSDLARASAGEEMGEAIAGFCREVYLIVAWHHEEEEEEEELGGDGAPEVE